ncbi:MAG: 6,7-dimethyl-8-ribityllumazine synthase [Armatimonadetes bacterium]|nr:6,7-dimethyl-8-ribityllumazine synthase [Armatimonadota bacterium]MBS1703854.1 6,7-dimethyl-8-ribityllumazine synthase [Armatimonadota bacterium]MBS1726231.1 6,7-dimethyl-8-ribityllumazine synthase [Armatimonadota bacterium]
MKEIRGKMDASKRQFAVVVSRWNELITKELLAGALAELESHGAKNVIVVHVPGTWEIPAVAKGLFESKKRVDAIVALGCIMQGQTPHAKLLGGDVGGALMSLQTEYGRPVTWGILTPDTQDQALDRAGLKMGNKGREAALAAIELADVLGQIESL